MKSYKFLMLGTAVALTMSSFSLSATVTLEDVNKSIVAKRTCPAPQIEEVPAPATQGWFSSFTTFASDAVSKARVTVGNTLRAGGELFDRTEDRSAAGQVKTSMIDVSFAYLTKTTGIPFSSAKDQICVFARKVLRTAGQWIKGGEETQTPERTFLNTAGLTYGSSNSQLQTALKAAEAQDLDAEVIAAKALNRGYGSKEQLNKINLDEIRVEALAEKILAADKDASFGTFSNNIMMQEKARTALRKLNKGQNFLEEIYQKIQIEQQFDNARKAAAAAA